MLEKNNLKKQLMNTTLEDVKTNYLIINSLFKSRIATTMADAKNYVNYVDFHGKISYRELGLLYSNTYWDYEIYVELQDEYELYKYINHEKVIETVLKYGNAYMFSPDYIVDHEKLGRDMLLNDSFAEYYYKVGKNIFSFADHNYTHEDEEGYINPDVAKECYKNVKRLRKNGHHVKIVPHIVLALCHVGEVA